MTSVAADFLLMNGEDADLSYSLESGDSQGQLSVIAWIYLPVSGICQLFSGYKIVPFT